nr:TetR/AcrR family transcriptional regulator [Aliiroseovarius sp. F20344]
MSAARDMIDEDGFDRVTMSALAKRAGLAKGTLYLYVRSKEELFLLLFVQAMERVVSRFKTETRPGSNAAQIAKGIAKQAQTTPLFLPMFARLVAMIESNVADEPLFAAKRQMMVLSAEWATHLAHVTGVAPDRIEPLAHAIMMAMQGAAQFDLSSQRDPTDLPEDIRDAFSRYAFSPSFEPSARLLLEAAMAKAPSE